MLSIGSMCMQTVCYGEAYPSVEHARVGLRVGEGIQGILQMFILLGLHPTESINAPSRRQCSLCTCMC